MSDSSTSNLQQFILASQATADEATVQLITKCIETPGVYIFLELLQAPNIQLLCSTQYAKYVELLQIFTFGTQEDYNLKKLSLPDLTCQMSRKLKQLTLISLASENKRLTYSLLMDKLDIQNLRELEDLIISCIYEGVIQAKLDQSKQLLEVTYSIARDIDLRSEASLDSMLDKLDAWCSNCLIVLNGLEKQATIAENNKKVRESKKKDLHLEIEEIKLNLKVAEMEDISTSSQPTLSQTAHSTIVPGKGVRGTKVGNNKFS